MERCYATYHTFNMGKNTLKNPTVFDSVPAEILDIITKNLLVSDLSSGLWLDNVMSFKIICKDIYNRFKLPEKIQNLLVMKNNSLEVLPNDRIALNKNFPREKPRREKVRVIFKHTNFLEWETMMLSKPDQKSIIWADHSRGTLPGQTVYYYVQNGKFVKSRRLLNIIKYMYMNNLWCDLLN